MMRYFLGLLFVLPQVLLFSQSDAAQDSIPWSIDLGDVVVTAQYTPGDQARSIQPITVVKAEEIVRQGFNNLAEVLTQQLNLRVGNDPILGNGLSIQGIGGQNIQVMIDGVPVVGRLGGNVDLSQISLENVAQVEILSGAQSARYGSNAAGGVINLISKRNQADNWRLELNGQLESIGIKRRAALLGRRFGQLQADIGVRWFETDFGSTDSLRARRDVELANGQTISERVIPWNPKEQFGLTANLQYSFNDSSSVRYSYQDFEEELVLYGRVRRPTFRPYSEDERYTTERQDHRLQFNHWFSLGGSNRLYIESVSAYNEFERRKLTERYEFEEDTSSLINSGLDTTNYRAILHRTILSTRLRGRWDAQLGIEYLAENGSGQRILDASQEDGQPADLRTISGWLGSRYRFSPNFELEGTLRFGHNNRYDYPVIPALNLRYQWQDNWQLRFGFAHGFRAPSVQELYFNFIDLNHYIIGNINLKPEYSRHLDLQFSGSLFSFPDLDLKVDARIFYNRIRNRITLAEFEQLRFNYQNVDQFQTHGLNLGFNYQIGKRLFFQLGTALTYLDNSLIDGETIDRFRSLVEFQSTLRYRIPAIEADFNIQHRHIGRQDRYFYDENDDLRLGFIEDYDLLNLSLNRNFLQNRLSLGLGVKNLLDVTQVRASAGNGGGAHSGTTGSQLIDFGRNFFVRLGVQL
ncbi:MAG: TonB-dependent receptor [Bacteroidota bacterium]